MYSNVLTIATTILYHISALHSIAILYLLQMRALESSQQFKMERIQQKLNLIKKNVFMMMIPADCSPLPGCVSDEHYGLIGLRYRCVL